MPDDLFRYALLVGLAIALVIAACSDLASRRIANRLNAAIALGAPLFWWASGFALWPDVAAQLGIALASFAVLSLLFALRAMGGGDVKLLAALALWIAPALIFKLIVLVSLLGGVLTLAFGGWHVLRRRRSGLTIPYGVAIALAGLWVIGADYLAAPAGSQVLG